MTVGTLSKSMFAGNLHTRFHMHTGPEATVELESIELIELSEGPEIVATRSFR